jgi:hypothetical protein
MAAPPAPFLSFRELYHDNTRDEDRGDPAPLMNTFDPNSPPVIAPNELFALLGREESSSTKSFLLLEQDPATPNIQGQVGCFHGSKQYRQGLGQPANQWTDRVFAFTGDVQHRNAPTTVEIPNTVFQRVAHGAAVRIFRPEVLILMLLADPTMLAVDSPQDFDPGWIATITRYSFPVPFQYVHLFLDSTLTPRDAFILVYQSAVAKGQVDIIRPLLNWLSLGLTRTLAVAAGTDHSRTGFEPLTAPRMDNTLRNHRWDVTTAKLPGLSLAPTTVSATQMTGAIGNIVQVMRGIRTDATTRAATAAIKTPSDHYGPILVKVMRLAQVGREEDLLPVHYALAKNKKTMARATWHQYAVAATQELGYHGLRIFVSPNVATKLNDGALATYQMDDLSAGVNLYQLGANTNESVDAMTSTAAAYDLAMEGGGNDFGAILGIVNTKSIELPLNFYMAEALLQMEHGLMQAMWGAHHPAVTALVQFLANYRRYQTLLQNYVPRSQNHYGLTPILLCQQWKQVKNAWALQQEASDTVIPFFETELNEMWMKLVMNDPSWEKPISQRYITPQPSGFSGSSPNAPPSFAPAAPALPAPPAVDTSRPAATERRQSPHINLHMNPELSLFRAKTGGKAIKKIVLDAKEAGNSVPTNGNGDEMCVTFHVFGSCSSNCQRRFDHHDLARSEKSACKKHTPDEDAKMIAWCRTAFD